MAQAIWAEASFMELTPEESYLWGVTNISGEVQLLMLLNPHEVVDILADAEESEQESSGKKATTVREDLANFEIAMVTWELRMASIFPNSQTWQ